MNNNNYIKLVRAISIWLMELKDAKSELRKRLDSIKGDDDPKVRGLAESIEREIGNG